MISYHTLTIDFSDRLSEIDRSEFIDKVYFRRKGIGSEILNRIGTEAVDALLFNKEPKDIHMVKKL